MEVNRSHPEDKQRDSLRSFAGQAVMALGRRLSAWSFLMISGGTLYFGLQGYVSAQVTILYSFGSGKPTTEGITPEGALVQAPNGSFYGTTYAQYGNHLEDFPAGTIYRLDSDTGKVSFVHKFPNTGPRHEPESPLLVYKGGLLGVTYGTNKNGGILFYLNSSDSLEEWHAFGNENSVGGSFPNAPLVVSPQDDLYGLTMYGGAQASGTAYKLSPKNRHLQVIHSFPSAGPSYPDSLLLGKDGNFYGVASGLYSSAIFQMTPAGAVTIIYTFAGNPRGITLTQASDGNFYGTTGSGESNGTQSYGSLFKMTGTPPDVTVTTLHVFGQGHVGVDPVGRVVMGPNGNLYGETATGGTGSDFGGDGILYEITPDGLTYTVLHNFKDGSIPNDGADPVGGLTLGSDNNFYGATSEGGAYNPGPFGGWGTLFKLTP
jgi:uncharacterized repeat protein (TIGR03803 family)